MAAPRYIVGNDAGEEYSVTMAAFRSIYAKRGFTILRNEDGSEYKTEKEVEGPSLQDLRSRAKDLGLSAGGSKADLANRIADAEKVPADPAPVGPPETPETPVES